MELSFTKNKGLYESVFEVTSDFNVHLEYDGLGEVSVYQRSSSSGNYSQVKDFEADDFIIDVDFTALVYPKSILIKSQKMPKMAELTTKS